MISEYHVPVTPTGVDHRLQGVDSTPPDSLGPVAQLVSEYGRRRATYIPHVENMLAGVKPAELDAVVEEIIRTYGEQLAGVTIITFNKRRLRLVLDWIMTTVTDEQGSPTDFGMPGLLIRRDIFLTERAGIWEHTAQLPVATMPARFISDLRDAITDLTSEQMVACVRDIWCAARPGEPIPLYADISQFMPTRVHYVDAQGFNLQVMVARGKISADPVPHHLPVFISAELSSVVPLTQHKLVDRVPGKATRSGRQRSEYSPLIDNA